MAFKNRSARRKLLVGSLIVGTVFVLVGTVTLGLSFKHQQAAASSTPLLLETEPPLEQTPQLISGIPARLLIDGLGIDLVIADGIYDEHARTWTLSRDKAHFATVSTIANNLRGNTYIYGHYRQGVFAGLHKIKPGTRAVIVTDNGHHFSYVFTSMIETKPNDVSPLTPSIEMPRLLLQTCSGSFFQNRQIYYFDFVDVD